MPVAIPICRNVLLTPEPSRPLGIDDADGRRGERRVDHADADARDEEAGQELRPAGVVVSPCMSSSATPMRAEPRPSRSRTGSLAESRPANGATTKETSESGRKRSAGLDRRVPEHVWR